MQGFELYYKNEFHKCVQKDIELCLFNFLGEYYQTK